MMNKKTVNAQIFGAVCLSLPQNFRILTEKRQKSKIKSNALSNWKIEEKK